MFHANDDRMTNIVFAVILLIHITNYHYHSDRVLFAGSILVEIQ